MSTEQTPKKSTAKAGYNKVTVFLLIVLAGAIGWLYMILWEWTAGRPITYVIREYMHKHPFQGGLVTLVIAVCDVWQMHHFHTWLAVILGSFVFLVIGHLFWDTAGPYIKSKRRVQQEQAGPPQPPVTNL